MKQSAVILLCLTACVLAGCAANRTANAGETYDARPQIKTYARIVYRSYRDARDQAVALQRAVNILLAKPDAQTLTAARKAWLGCRDSYGRTEAFRFYEGPIDFVDQKTGTEGPEGLINGWPLNEAFIDYVKGNPTAGIVNMKTVPISKDVLVKKNAAEDEKNITTGYHAIEFLLWGQDLRLDGPGNRPAGDFARGDPVRDRRRTYLKVTTDLLIEHLNWLVDQWAPGKANYRARFENADQREALGHILSGLATLSGFELASERMAVALDSGAQEDEHSCFSDNTHNDLIANARGISNVYFGVYGNFKGKGINQLVKAVAPQLNAKIEAQLIKTQQLVDKLDAPIDQTLASPKGSARRAKMEAAIKSLQAQAELLRQLSKPLGVKVVIAAE